MEKFLITTIQVNLVPNPSERGEGNTNSPDAISLPLQPFLGRHLGFHIFFHFWGRTLFFSVGCF